MFNKNNLKKILYFIGKSLGIIGLVFVFYKLSQEYSIETFSNKMVLLSHTIPSLVVLNVLSLLIGIFVWYRLLRNYSQKTFPFLAAYYYFTKTDIAKYLPGNVFHYVGRQVLAAKLHLTQVEMGKISFLNIILLLTGTILASSLFAFVAKGTPLSILTLLGLSSMITIIILLYIYPSFPRKEKIMMNLYIAVSIALQGVMLSIVIAYQSEAFSTNLFMQCAGIYTLSWLIGFVTPGASGGLGVREGVFIAAMSYLHINIAEEIVLFSVLFIRLINIMVDVLLYLSTYTLEKKMKELKL